MTKRINNSKHIEPLLKSEGTEYFVLMLYGIRPLGIKRIVPVGFDERSNLKTIKHFPLGDSDWSFKLDLYEIACKELPKYLEEYLGGAMKHQTDGGVILSWFMLDGVFNDINNLFMPWEAMHTYGAKSLEKESVIAIDSVERKSETWRQKLNQRSDDFYTRYPNLEGI